jgi:hypothetical protein
LVLLLKFRQIKPELIATPFVCPEYHISRLLARNLNLADRHHRIGKRKLKIVSGRPDEWRQAVRAWPPPAFHEFFKFKIDGPGNHSPTLRHCQVVEAETQTFPKNRNAAGDL